MPKSNSKIRSYFARRKRKFGDVAINIAGWICIPLGLLIIFAVAKPFQSACYLDAGAEFVGFVDYKLFLAQVIGAVVLLGLLAILRSIASHDDWQKVQTRAVAEFFAIVMNFGSLYAVSAIIFIWAAHSEVDQLKAHKENFVGIVNAILGVCLLLSCCIFAPVNEENSSEVTSPSEHG